MHYVVILGSSMILKLLILFKSTSVALIVAIVVLRSISSDITYSVLKVL